VVVQVIAPFFKSLQTSASILFNSV